MSHHRFHSIGSVPFSWENSPGVSKVAPQHGKDSCTSTETDESLESVDRFQLQPPLDPVDRPRRLVGRQSIYVPLPPCPFQGSTNKLYVGRNDDPFLAAYIECTKSMKKVEGKKKKKESSGWGFWRFSCKQGTGVREDGLVKMSADDDSRDHRLLLVKSKSQRSGSGGGHQRRNSLLL